MSRFGKQITIHNLSACLPFLSLSVLVQMTTKKCVQIYSAVLSLPKMRGPKVAQNPPSATAATATPSTRKVFVRGEALRHMPFGFHRSEPGFGGAGPRRGAEVERLLGDGRRMADRATGVMAERYIDGRDSVGSATLGWDFLV